MKNSLSSGFIKIKRKLNIFKNIKKRDDEVGKKGLSRLNVLHHYNNHKDKKRLRKEEEMRAKINELFKERWEGKK